MRIQEFYQLSLQKGIDADFRSNDYVARTLERKKKKFEKLSEKEKVEFDQESLTNPYSDTRILHVAQEKELKKVLIGIDIDTAEILLAKELGDIDLVVSHHPAGRALADLHEVMELQADIYSKYGVPIHVGEGMLRDRIFEVARGINPRNNWRAVDAAKLLAQNFMCLHTVADNISAQFVTKEIEKVNPERVEDLLEVLGTIEEYKQAATRGAGLKIFTGNPENRCGKVLVDMTGGTEGPPKMYERISQAGIGTIVAMHISEEHRKEAEAAHVNVVVAGHMSSDSIGMNILLDELEKQGTEIVPCGGFIRVSRVN